MSRPRLLLLRPLLFVLAVGLFGPAVIACSNVGSPEPLLDEENTEVLAEPSVPYRVAFVPMELAPDIPTQEVRPTRDGTRISDGEETHRCRWGLDTSSRRDYMNELVEAFQHVGAFERVEYLPTSTGSTEQQLEEAWERGFDVVARPVLTTLEGTYEGRTGAWAPSLLMWFLLVPPTTWWIANESFGARMVVQLELYSTATRETRPLESLEIRDEIVRNLHDFNQGFHVFNIFRTPGALSESAWNNQIRGNLFPLVERATQRKLLEAARDPEHGQALARALEAHRGHLQKTMALMIGTRPQESRLPLFPDSDVDALEEALRLRPAEPQLVRPWGFRSLKGVGATRSEFSASLAEHFGTHLIPGDRALLVLALRGVVDAEGRGYLLFSDSHVAEPESGLAVEELAVSLADLPAEIAVLGAVSWSDAEGKPLEEGAADPWQPLAEEGSNVLLVTPNEPSVPVLEMEEVSGSLFLREVAEALKQPELIDAGAGNGWVSLAEVFAATQGTLEEISAFEGQPQGVYLRGNTALFDRPLFRYDAEASLSIPLRAADEAATTPSPTPAQLR